MELINNMINIYSRSEKSNGAVVIPYQRYVPIQSNTSSHSSSSNTDNTLESISDYSFSSSQPIFTKNSKQSVLCSILKTFFYQDLTSFLPELDKWGKWSKERGYIQSRIIRSDNHLYLLAFSLKEDCDVYQLPYSNSRGGTRKPILFKTISSVQIGIFQEMFACKNVSGGMHYCGYCPSCLRFQSDRKVFVNKRSEIRRCESEIVELKELSEKGQSLIDNIKQKIVDMETFGRRVLAKKIKNKLSRLETWKKDPSRHLLYREDRIRRLSAPGKKLNDNSKLIQLPHWMISISCPNPLHAVFNAQDAWMTKRASKCGRRRSEGVQRILAYLEGKEGSFLELMRSVFWFLVAEAVKEQYPGIELTMEHQMHPCNKFGNSPDIHFLVCKTALDKEGQVKDISFDVDALKREIESRMQLFSDFLEWCLKRWNTGCRSADYKLWKRAVLAAIKEIRSNGIPGECVDGKLVPVAELLGTHCYIRRQPMQNVKSLFLERNTGTVRIGYFGGDCHHTFGILDFLFRFVDFDGRKLRVQYGGAYRSTRGLKRDIKIDALYKAISDSAMELQVLKLRHFQIARS